MRSIALAVGVSAVAVTAAAVEQQVFRGRADVVQVYTTVHDRNGRLVTGLVQEEFQIFDNGKSQPITLFDSAPQPIRLIVMLDVSGSMSGNVRLVQLACEQLFKQLRPDDQVKIGTFGEEIRIMPNFTRDIGALRAAVPTSISPNAPTPLYRGLDQALSSFGDAQGRRVILVLSDGKNGGMFGFGQKFYTVVDIIDRAQIEDVMVYGVGLEGRSASGFEPPDPELPRLALETGGGYFEIRPGQDLGASFANVADELHQQYLIGFAPAVTDGKLHKIEVKLSKRDLRARARKNYQAPKR